MAKPSGKKGKRSGPERGSAGKPAAPRPGKAGDGKAKPAGPKPRALPPAEMEEIKKLLLAKRKILTGDVSHMKDEALTASGQEAAVLDVSSFAEMGSDSYEQDFTIGRIESEAGELLEIEGALERIEAGTYGMCESCNKPIPKSRLMALPFACLCVACKRKEETEAGS